MYDFNSTIDYEDPDIVAIIDVRYVFYVVQCVGMTIEIVFFFVMIRNWCQKTTHLKSAFFYLTTMKIFIDFFYMFYVVVTTYWYTEVADFYYVTAFWYYSFCAEVDTWCQLAIAANRFTALMMTLNHDRASFFK